jgi:hypothetical protein
LVGGQFGAACAMILIWVLMFPLFIGIYYVREQAVGYRGGDGNCYITRTFVVSESTCFRGVVLYGTWPGFILVVVALFISPLSKSVKLKVKDWIPKYLTAMFLSGTYIALKSFMLVIIIMCYCLHLGECLFLPQYILLMFIAPYLAIASIIVLIVDAVLLSMFHMALHNLIMVGLFDVGDCTSYVFIVPVVVHLFLSISVACFPTTSTYIFSIFFLPFNLIWYSVATTNGGMTGANVEWFFNAYILAYSVVEFIMLLVPHLILADKVISFSKRQAAATKETKTHNVAVAARGNKALENPLELQHSYLMAQDVVEDEDALIWVIKLEAGKKPVVFDNLFEQYVPQIHSTEHAAIHELNKHLVQISLRNLNRESFAALSWRWDVKKPKSLDEAVTIVSPTICKFLNVCKSLGIEYAWVDWCCIRQYGNNILSSLYLCRAVYYRCRVFTVPSILTNSDYHERFWTRVERSIFLRQDINNALRDVWAAHLVADNSIPLDVELVVDLWPPAVNRLTLDCQRLTLNEYQNILNKRLLPLFLYRPVPVLDLDGNVLEFTPLQETFGNRKPVTLPKQKFDLRLLARPTDLGALTFDATEEYLKVMSLVGIELRNTKSISYENWFGPLLLNFSSYIEFNFVNASFSVNPPLDLLPEAMRFESGGIVYLENALHKCVLRTDGKFSVVKIGENIETMWTIEGLEQFTPVIMNKLHQLPRSVILFIEKYVMGHIMISSFEFSEETPYVIYEDLKSRSTAIRKKNQPRSQRLATRFELAKLLIPMRSLAQMLKELNGLLREKDLVLMLVMKHEEIYQEWLEWRDGLM